MSFLPFPSDSAEFEEYTTVMNEIADHIEVTTPDPEPESFGGRCEDAPCCGCCDNELYDSAMEYEQQRARFHEEPEGWTPDEESDELRAREDEDYYANMYEREEPEDRYLDSSWEDQSEYGMEGCCGDF
jgi:hypothetical protein